MRSVIVIGAGGFGREVLDVLDDQGVGVRGVVDDAPTETNLSLLRARDVEYLGATSVIADKFSPREIEYLIGIGSGSVRRRIDQSLSAFDFAPATVVHSAATFGHTVDLAPGVVVCAGVRITTNVRVGRHTHLNLNVTVGHDVALSDFVTINPGAAISGEVSIAAGAMIGANAFILQGLSIGDDSIVGASAAVMKEVEPRTTVAGVPARLLSRR